MKTKLLIVLLCWAIRLNASAQGFVNLNFEACTLPTNAHLNATVSQALPGWTLYRGGVVQSQVPYNAGIAQQSFLSLDSTVFSYPSLFGNYNARLIVNSFDSLDIALAQTGQVPEGTHSLQFKTDWANRIPAGGLVVSFENTTLSLQPVGFFPGYTLWEADISAFAGATGELRFTANHSGGPWGAYFDDIMFVPVPEPSTWALLALGSALFACAARRGRGR